MILLFGLGWRRGRMEGDGLVIGWGGWLNGGGIGVGTWVFVV